jgi:hypothetical protein
MASSLQANQQKLLTKNAKSLSGNVDISSISTATPSS